MVRRRGSVLWWGLVIGVFVWLCSSAVAGSGRPRQLKIFDGKPKLIVVNGYSTSFLWPDFLQRKLDRYFDGRRVLTVVKAVKGGTPVAKWIDVKTGQPRRPWLKVLGPALKQAGDRPVIVLAQQSLQWVFGGRAEGIAGPNDAERIRQGADALEKYVRRLISDGADVVFVTTHIYKRPMEPQIGNERYALEELLRRGIEGVCRGPDLWTATKKVYPQAFAEDGLHPNSTGAQIMAQGWFETLLRYDGLVMPRRRDRDRQRRAVPAGVRVLRDMEYVPSGHERQKLDLYLPSRSTGRALPVIIWVHGGAWRAGSKDRCPAVRFVQRGYAVASINYRLSQHARFPAQIEDCKAAVRWLRANAERYRLDPQRFGAWGSSAGGHLVALLGTTGDIKRFDTGPNLQYSSALQAVCDFYGPTDFTQMSKFWSKMDHDAPDSPEALLIGGPVQQNKQKCRLANPITYVSKQDPPFLIVHGDKDPLVPHNQSVLLYEALRKVSVPVQLYTVDGGGHGGFKDPQLDKLVEKFFDEHLKAGGRW